MLILMFSVAGLSVNTRAWETDWLLLAKKCSEFIPPPLLCICEVNCNLSTLLSCGVHFNAAIVHVFIDYGGSLASAEISNSKNFDIF